MYQNCPQYWALGRVTVRLSPIWMNSIHHHSWAGHPDISFTQRSVHLSMPWALQEDPVGNSVKALLNPDKQHPQPFPSSTRQLSCRRRRSGWPSRTSLSYTHMGWAISPAVLYMPYYGTQDDLLHLVVHWHKGHTGITLFAQGAERTRHLMRYSL